MSSSIQLNIFWKSRTLSLMQSGLMFVNTLLIIVTIHSHLGAGAELFPDKPLPKAIQDSGGESSSDFLDNALSPNYLVASSSDDASSRYLDPTDSTNQKNSLLVNENSLSINTGDGCSSYHSQMNSKRMRRWDCGPDLPPNCCPPPASTPEKQSHPLENQQPPKSTNQEESDHEDPSPKPVDNPLDNKKPFPLKKNEDICPFSSFGMRNLPVCDSGDPDQATWHRGSGPPGYYILDDCFPCMPNLFHCRMDSDLLSKKSQVLDIQISLLMFLHSHPIIRLLVESLECLVLRGRHNWHKNVPKIKC